MNTRVVWRYTQPHLAYIHQGVLKENQIESFIFGENFISTAPFMSGLLHASVELRVKEKDYEKAVALLRPELKEPVQCEKCGSTELQFSYGKSKWKIIGFSLLSAISGNPFGNLERHYFCKNCGYKNG